MRKMRQARNKEIPTQDDSPFLTSDSFVRQLSNSHKAWGNCVKRKLTQCSGLNGHTICIIQEGDFQKNQNGTTRGEICHCHHCRWQCKNFASGVNFSKKQHIWLHNQHKKSSLLNYLFFFQNCWTSSCLNQKCQITDIYQFTIISREWKGRKFCILLVYNSLP